jgi:undecaprenyl-phosphate 4-deoxy-4-formamido-L-arabinose transferase
VRHEERKEGSTGYTLRRLVRLWMNMFFNFSVMPLRLAGALGFLLCLLGATLAVVVVIEKMLHEAPIQGWASLMAAVSVFSGAQLLILGVIGEYLGRTYLTLSGRPQSLVRSIRRHDPSA